MERGQRVACGLPQAGQATGLHTKKKSVRAREQCRADVVTQRQAFHERLAGVAQSRLVFLDETGAKTNMTRLYARARKGTRALDYAPHGHWNTTTLVAALTAQGASAPMVLDGPMDRACFEAYVGQVLIPALTSGSIVVMDNLAAHKSPAITQMLHRAGIDLWYLPPYSPDLNPIELMWAKLKASLRGAKARTQEALVEAIAQALEEVTPEHSRNFFCHCFVCEQS
jgi:transposase